MDSQAPLASQFWAEVEDFLLASTGLLPNTVFLSEGTWATWWEVVVVDTIMGSCSVSSFGVVVSGLWLLIELGPSIFLSWKMLGVSRWGGLVFSTFMAAFSPLSHQTGFVCFVTFGGVESALCFISECSWASDINGGNTKPF